MISYLKKKLKKFFFEKIYFGIINMKTAGDVMLNDIKNRSGLIYPKKITTIT